MKTSILAFFAIALFPALLIAEPQKDPPKHQAARERMVASQIISRGITDRNVLHAMKEVPRHIFVPKALASKAYADHPLPIGQGQTISQPYIVALMTESLKLKGSERVLEIGTGSGYFGWIDAAPFDCIMITAAIDHIPPPLLKQLKDGGRLILPLGNPFSYQNLSLVTKQNGDFTVSQITGVLFVPMTGYALDRK